LDRAQHQAGYCLDTHQHSEYFRTGFAYQSRDRVGYWRRSRRRFRGHFTGQAVMFLGDDEIEIRKDDTRRLRVLYTAVGLAMLVLLAASYFS